MMSDLVKILLNIDKSKSLEINTKSINRGLSKICIFCQLSMRYISSKFRLHCLFYENASEPLFCSVLSGMILSFVNRGCWRHLEEEFPFLVLVLLCWIDLNFFLRDFKENESTSHSVKTPEETS